MRDMMQGQLNKLKTLGAQNGVEAEEMIRREIEKLDEGEEG